ncbi:MAG: zinc ribbon domain-containing protein [Desulfobacterales bacterium]
MPIYEFKCMKCDDYFELLVMNRDETVDLKCTHCDSEDFERIISTTSTRMGDASGSNTGVSTHSRSCSNGSCATYEIPGHTR